MGKFHVLYLYRWAELAKVETEGVPVNAEHGEWRPLVALDDVLFECSAIDMEANGIFNFSRTAMFVDADRYLHRGKVFEFGRGVSA
jgi:hypothetical protein